MPGWQARVKVGMVLWCRMWWVGGVERIALFVNDWMWFKKVFRVF